MPRQKREIPWIFKRENGVYYAGWYDAAQKRTRQCSLHTSDEGEAKTAFGQFLLNGRTIYESADDGLSVEAGLEHYLREHVAKKCADPSRQEDAARHLKTFFADTLFADLDIPMSRQYADARRKGEVGGGKRRKNKSGSDSTIRRELTVLIAAANHNVKWKRLSASNLPSVELPAETSAETPWYTKEELLRIFEAADGYLLRFCRLAYWTAGRKAAVQNLRKDQIKFDAGRIDLHLPGRWRTKKRNPIVPLYDEIRPDIDWLIEHADTDYLFGRRDFYRPYRELLGDLAMPHKAHPHIMRHTRATHLLQKSVSIYDVAKLLGDTVQTVERTYGHHSSEFLAQTTGGM